MMISTLGTSSLSARAWGSTVLFISAMPSEVNVAPAEYGEASMAVRNATMSVCVPNVMCTAACVENDAKLTRNEPSARPAPSASITSTNDATKGSTAS